MSSSLLLSAVSSMLRSLKSASQRGDSESAMTARALFRPSLTVFDDARLRVVQVITAIQRGGAEKVVACLPYRSADVLFQQGCS